MRLPLDTEPHGPAIRFHVGGLDVVALGEPVVDATARPRPSAPARPGPARGGRPREARPGRGPNPRCSGSTPFLGPRRPDPSDPRDVRPRSPVITATSGSAIRVRSAISPGWLVPISITAKRCEGFQTRQQPRYADQVVLGARRHQHLFAIPQHTTHHLLGGGLAVAPRDRHQPAVPAAAHESAQFRQRLMRIFDRDDDRRVHVIRDASTASGPPCRRLPVPLLPPRSRVRRNRVRSGQRTARHVGSVRVSVDTPSSSGNPRGRRQGCQSMASHTSLTRKTPCCAFPSTHI